MMLMLNNAKSYGQACSGSPCGPDIEVDNKTLYNISSEIWGCYDGTLTPIPTCIAALSKIKISGVCCGGWCYNQIFLATNNPCTPNTFQMQFTPCPNGTPFTVTVERTCINGLTGYIIR